MLNITYHCIGDHQPENCRRNVLLQLHCGLLTRSRSRACLLQRTDCLVVCKRLSYVCLWLYASSNIRCDVPNSSKQLTSCMSDEKNMKSDGINTTFLPRLGDLKLSIQPLYRGNSCPGRSHAISRSRPIVVQRQDIFAYPSFL